ncbi:hypothetical protein DER44DRAFT_654886 [Fusarium oxysporum]|nr:hypothetical protein DER44DRAFT_654886 [Fusarium oxysporum]
MAEVEIKSLLVRERYYRDTSQWNKLRACYHPDASKTNIDISWFQGDIDGFVIGSQGMVTGGTGAMHTICPVDIHLNGTKALSESTGSISIRFQHSGIEYDCVSFTRFISCLELVHNEWKLLSLQAIYDRDTIVPVVPRELQDVSFVQDARQSYKCIDWVLSRKGFKIKQDLPGTDKPAMSERLMKERLDWLNKQ